MVLLEGATVADAMGPPPTSIPATMTLSEALDRHLREHHERTFPVVDEQRLVGLLTWESASKVGQHDPMSTVASAMVPLGEVNRLQRTLPLGLALTQLGGASALVLDGELLVGVLSVDGVSRYATLRQRGQAPTDPAGSPTIPPRPDV
jgi:hypothetical protein